MSDTTVLEKVYDPGAVEEDIYRLWEESHAFESRPTGDRDEKTFCMVIPPPNVTGALHLGHALNNTLQDILVRWHRMRGFNTLWQPGTDHAGIATQAVVERRIRQQEGKSRHALGRDELVRRIWAWKDEYEQRILTQLKLMGCSCDWSRLRFTLDDGLARAVRHIFFKLFKDGLIFRGKRLVNWDPQLQTAVADDEVYHETVKGHFWHIRYPVIDPKPGEPDHVVIATTRPETMLGDVAVAVNPDPGGVIDRTVARLEEKLARTSGREHAESRDRLEAVRRRRENDLDRLTTLRDMARDGRTLRLPLVDREIPLITDEWADPTLGSGCVKITPAHDPNDYEVGQRHDLPMINVLTPDGKVAPIIEPDGSTNPASTTYAGLAFSTDGRARVVADLEAGGCVEKVEDRDTEVGHSDRSKTPIEPYLSDQWFVRTGDNADADLVMGNGARTKGLAQAAMDEVTSGSIHIYPSRYAKSYLDWLSEKRDWCISRQLWWGHRIPVWHKRVNLTESHGCDHLAGKAGVDEIIQGNSKDAALITCRADTGELVAPITELMLVEKGAAGDHDLYLCTLNDAPDPWSSMDAFENDGFARDPDVLDTWFSSALWPFSTLGWPEETPHLKQYYPTSVLCTSRDIITNWVARMVMFGLYATGRKPFDHVYIHPKILDGRGETMSKSKGNGVDPVDIIRTHGADALRYSMAEMTTETQDIRMPVDYVCPHCGRLVEQAAVLKAEAQRRKSRGERFERKLQPADVLRVRCAHEACGGEFATRWADDALKRELGLGRETSEKFEVGRNFCNKLWNAARFAFMNLEGTDCRRLSLEDLAPEDRWVLSRLSRTIRRAHQCMENYEFSALVRELREFFWDALCDWYIELTKPRLASATRDSGEAGVSEPQAADAERGAAVARQVLALCLDQVLRLFHPIIPFITERLWARLNEVAPRRGLPGLVDLEPSPLLIRAPMPPPEGYPVVEDARIIEMFTDLQTVVRGVRDLRARCGVSPKDAVAVTVIMPRDRVEPFREQQHIVSRMARVSRLEVLTSGKRPRNAASLRVGALSVYVLDVTDDQAERKRASKSLEEATRRMEASRRKLDNERFVGNAAPDVVEAERCRFNELCILCESLRARMAEFEE